MTFWLIHRPPPQLKTRRIVFKSKMEKQWLIELFIKWKWKIITRFYSLWGQSYTLLEISLKSTSSRPHWATIVCSRMFLSCRNTYRVAQKYSPKKCDLVVSYLYKLHSPCIIYFCKYITTTLNLNNYNIKKLTSLMVYLIRVTSDHTAKQNVV